MELREPPVLHTAKTVRPPSRLGSTSLPDRLTARRPGNNPTKSSLLRHTLDTLDSSEIVEDAVCTARPIEFAHACEEEFARMLDAREVSWQYKPRTFAVEWDEEGNFVDCFTPDFYLPANGMYIALIAPDRKASNAKTRHLKLLRRQRPEIRIELFTRTTAGAAEVHIVLTPNSL